MNYSHALFLIPAACFATAVALGSGACSSSTSITIPTPSSAPEGTTFVGGTFGGDCSGYIYVPAGTGWAFCDADKWDYTTMDPDADGYSADSNGDDASTSGVDAGPQDADLNDDGSYDDGGQQKGHSSSTSSSESSDDEEDGGQQQGH